MCVFEKNKKDIYIYRKEKKNKEGNGEIFQPLTIVCSRHNSFERRKSILARFWGTEQFEGIFCIVALVWKVQNQLVMCS